MAEIFDVRIDGDTLLYRAGFSADSRSDDITHSLFNCKLLINMIMEKFPGDCTIYLSGSRKVNWRYDLSPIYKGNRKLICKNKLCKSTDLSPVEKIQQADERFYRAFQCNKCTTYVPDSKCIYHDEIRGYLVAKHGALICPWGEADDWLGVDLKPNTVVVSNDKDLLMLPCLHYRLTSEKLLEASDPGQLWLSECRKKLLGVGFKWFCCQLLLGDGVDNIKKPRAGFGPVAAYEMMNSKQTITGMWNTAVSFYKDSGKTTDEFLLNCKLLWISREKRQVFDVAIVKSLIEKYDFAGINPITGDKITEDHVLLEENGVQVYGERKDDQQT